jgi:hypothetical protein
LDRRDDPNDPKISPVKCAQATTINKTGYFFGAHKKNEDQDEFERNLISSEKIIDQRVRSELTAQ